MSTADDIPHFAEAVAILKPVAERVYELLEQAAPDLDDHDRHESFNESVHTALAFLHKRDRVGRVDIGAVSANSDLLAIADSLPLLVEGFERCRPFWKGTTRSERPAMLPSGDLANSTMVLMLIGEEMYLMQNSGTLYFASFELDELSPRDR
jgi:hypothetical protein